MHTTYIVCWLRLMQAVAEVTTPAAPTNTGSGGNKAEAAVAAAVYEPLPGVLVCCCDTTIPPEQAGAWSRGILAELQPKRLLLLGSMQVCWWPCLWHCPGKHNLFNTWHAASRGKYWPTAHGVDVRGVTQQCVAVDHHD